MHRHTRSLWIQITQRGSSSREQIFVQWWSSKEKKIQQMYSVSLRSLKAIGGKDFWVSLYLVLVLSGQPRFSASHALITLPSVKIAPKEGVGSEREWHTFSTHETLRLMYYCTWRQPSPVMMHSVLIHLSCCRHDYEGSCFLSSHL